jgi:ABC-type glycerol-3-phosphate transport system substrate-binding protein
VIVKGTDTVDGGWAVVKFLSSPWFQERYLTKGLWLPNQTALMTPEAIARWCVKPVHPDGYDMIVTQYAPKYGHYLTMPVGYSKAADTVLNPALEQIWTGEVKAADAMAVVADANAVMEEEASR